MTIAVNLSSVFYFVNQNLNKIFIEKNWYFLKNFYKFCGQFYIIGTKGMHPIIPINIIKIIIVFMF
jgi:hypothetical protein